MTLGEALKHVHQTGYVPWDSPSSRAQTELMQRENLIRFRKTGYRLTQRGNYLLYTYTHNIADLNNLERR